MCRRRNHESTPARGDSLVEARDEFDRGGQRFDLLIPSNRHHPVGKMAPSISAGCLCVKRAGNEVFEARLGSGRLLGERGDFVARAVSWQRSVVKQRLTGAGCHERPGIRAHRANGVPIIIESGMAAARQTRVAVPRIRRASPIRLTNLRAPCWPATQARAASCD